MGAKFSSGKIQVIFNKFLMTMVVEEIEALHFPAFNHTFMVTLEFDVMNDPVQVGAFIEWLCQEGIMFRSHTPFYSFLSGKPL